MKFKIILLQSFKAPEPVLISKYQLEGIEGYKDNIF